MSGLVLGLASVLLAIQVPQTRAEFIDAVAAGKGPTAVETFTVGRGLDAVYAALEDRSGTCLDVTVERSAYVGYWEVSSSDYNPTLERVDQRRAEFTLQVAHRPRGVGHTPPPDGLYIMAADLRAAGDASTEVVLYRPTMGFKKIASAFRGWIEGTSSDCPKLR
jgi:hypothetical protein